MSVRNLEFKPPWARIDWKRYDRLLGKRTDREVARLTGICGSSVFHRRIGLGIPARGRSARSPRAAPAASPSRKRRLRAWERVDWKRIDPLLGHRTDSAIAAEFHLDAGYPRMRRHQLGIPVFDLAGSFWAPFDSRLGKVSDSVIAREAGVTRAGVHVRRKQLGIRAHHSPHPPRFWKALDRRLGKRSDAQVARALGVNRDLVSRRRNELRIPSHAQALRMSVDWKSVYRLMGKQPDARIARSFAIPTSWVSYRRARRGIRSRWSKYQLKLHRRLDPLVAKGMLTDLEVARRVGCCSAAVRDRRRLLGLPPNPSRSAIDWSGIDPRLGKVTDGDVARMADLALSTVRTRRRRLGIVSFAARRRERLTREVRKLARRGLKNAEIARLLKMSAGIVGKRVRCDR